MRLKVLIATLLTLGINIPTWAAGIYEIDPAYQQAMMLDQVNTMDLLRDKNQPGGFDQPCGWTCRVNVSGWINTDAYIASSPPVFSTLNPFFNYLFENLPANAIPFLIPTSGRASDLILNNANLFIDARVNNWVTANVSLIYTSLTGVAGSQGVYQIPNSLFVYRPVSRTNIDTAYATIQHFNVSPLYLRVGKEYIPFDQYNPYSFVTSENPTQLFSEINATAVQLGFTMPSGLYGSLYTFAGNPKLSDGGSTRRIQNGGIDLGYSYNGSINSFNIDAGYIANITDSNFLSSYYTNTNIEFAVNNVPGLPNQKTPAYNVNAAVQLGPFDANAHYVATTRDFAKSNILAFPVTFPPEFIPPLTFEKPKLWGIEVGFTFPIIFHQSRLAVGYQGTDQLVGLLPQKRLYIDYMMNINQWFDVGVAIFQDKDYALGTEQVRFNNTPVIIGGTGSKSTVGQLRASIKFA